MGDILDSLFGALPVLIAVIWIIRLFGGRKKRKKDASGNSAKQGVMSRRKSVKTSAEGDDSLPDSPWRFPGTNTEGTLRRRKTLEEVVARVNDFAEHAGHQVHEDRGEQVQYEKPAPRRVGPAPVRQKADTESPASLVVDTDEAADAYSDIGDEPGPSALERISSLSPLARGMLWSTILGEPVGMKDPMEERW